MVDYVGAIKTLESKLRSAVDIVKVTNQDSMILLEMLYQRTSIQSDDLSSITDQLNELSPVIQSFFDLPHSEVIAFKKMVKLTFVGCLYQLNPKEDDPYAFEQLEWLLRESETFSVLATAMRLSLEKADSTGPQGLSLEIIPTISIAYRCALLAAHVMHQYKDISVISEQLKTQLSDYLDSDQTNELTEKLIDDLSKRSVQWISPLHLKPNMMVMEDVRDSEGLLLISRHTIMTESIINTLLTYGTERGLTNDIPVQALS